jgi:hypothetical protein
MIFDVMEKIGTTREFTILVEFLATELIFNLSYGNQKAECFSQ